MKNLCIIPGLGNTKTGAECKPPIKFNLSVADVRGQRTNTSYPHRVTISSAEDLAKAAAFDHASGRFSDYERSSGEIIKAYRSLSTFLDSDCDIFDADNDPGSNSLPDIPPDQWKYPADIDAMFPGVASYTIYSAHHMVEKEGRPARPKFHKYYPRRKPLTDAKQAKAFHKEVQDYCPAFDANALDAARFIFGVVNPIVEYVPGEMTLDEFMEQRRTTKAVQERPAYRGAIYEGQRNSELSRQALKLLKRFGPGNGRAIKAFFQAAGGCEPPLDENELESIWNSALKGYGEKVLTDPGYIPPAEYESKEYAGSLEPADYTDVGQAAVFAETFGDVVKYTTATKWLVYDGAVWKESELKARSKAQELTDMQLEEAQKRINAARQSHDSALIRGSKAEMEKQKLDNEEYFRKFVLSERKSNKITAMLTEAAPKLEIDDSHS